MSPSCIDFLGMNILNNLKKAATETLRYVRKLQRSDEAVKKRWLIGGAAATMVVLILLWVVYLNIVLPPVTQVQVEEEIGPTALIYKKESPFSVFIRGAGVVTSRFGNFVSGAVDTLRDVIGGREFSFEGKEINTE